MDRRKSFVDVIERVLGNPLPSTALTKWRLFKSDPYRGGSTVGSTISEIHVSVLDSIEEGWHY